MARSDLILNLVKAGTIGDYALLKTTVEALVAEERAKQHHTLADRLLENLKQPQASYFRNSELDDSLQDLFWEIRPKRRLDELILNSNVQTICSELVEEHHRKDLLQSYGLEPRHKILLAGPPGNGKTSLAEALAESMLLPVLIVRYDAIIGSYLGETAKRLRLLLDYAKTRSCLLFFDEFESISKERGDPHETGEMKRLVSSLLLQVDRLPGNVVVVAATNHPEMLDRAVWRRFQIQLDLMPPTTSQIKTWLEAFETRLETKIGNLPSLAEKLKGLSFAEVEQFTTDLHRRYILEKPKANIKKIIEARLSELPMRGRLST